jgi:hypothetical protein
MNKLTSYGETSGFTPMGMDELQAANGGISILLILLGIAATALSSCAQPTNIDELNRNGGKP